MCASPDNNKLLSEDVKYLGVGGHLFAIAAQKSLEYGFGGFMYGFAANQNLLQHYVEVFNGEIIAMLHPYQFAIDEENAKRIMEMYDYDWTDDEIYRIFKTYARTYYVKPNSKKSGFKRIDELCQRKRNKSNTVN